MGLVLTVMLVGVATFANVYAPQPLLPFLQHEFGVSTLQSSLVITSTTLVLALALPLYGIAADVLPTRRVVVACALGSGLATLGLSLAPSFAWFTGLRMLQSLLLAGLPASVMGYTGRVLPPKEANRVVGYYIAATSIGGIGGRMVVGVVSSIASWHLALALPGSLALLAALLAWFYLEPQEQAASLDLAQLRERLVHAAREALARRYLYPVYALAFFVMASFVGLFNYLTFYLAGPPFLFSASLTGLVFLTYLPGTVISTASGRISDWLGEKRAIQSGLLVMLAGFALAAAEGALNSSLAVVWAAALLAAVLCFLTPGFFLTHSTASSLASRAGSATAGLYLMSYYLGASAGSTGLGFLWTRWQWPGVLAGCFTLVLAALAASTRLAQQQTAPHSAR